MRTRQEIKEYAKEAFAAQRGTCVLGLFLVMLVTIGFSYFSNIPSIVINIPLISQDYSMAFLGIFAVLSMIIGIIAIPAMMISMVLNVNISGFFVKVYYGQFVKFSEPYSEIKNNFGRKLGGMCWHMLWIYLWSLAFMTPAVIIMVIVIVTAISSFSYTAPVYAAFVSIIAILLACIPIMIKTLSYSMTQYILASNPNVKATDAIKLSMRMTRGHKGKIFVMWLSFIGWNILDVFTIGILGIFYVNPYMYASLAGQFVELRSLAVANGVIHPSELDGAPPQNVQYYQHHQYAPEQTYAGYQQQPHYAPYPQQQPHYTPYPQQQPLPQAQYYTPESMQNPIPQAPQYVQEPTQPQIPQAPPIPEPPPQPIPEPPPEQMNDDGSM